MDSRLNSIRNIWKAINSICSYKPQNKHTRFSHISTDQGSISDSSGIAQAFNNYFANVGGELAARINKISNGFRDYLLHSNPHSLFLDPASENEIYNTIMSLNKSNSTGSDGIISRVLMLAAKCIAAPLMHIVNLSFEQGVFPSAFKTAKVIPIYKKGKTDVVENYRPISLLSNLNKIFEKLMHKRL